MQFAKFDAELSRLLTDEPVVSLPVFVKLQRAPSTEELEVLASHGVPPEPGRQLLSATLSKGAVAALSDLDCVRSIRLSQQLHARPAEVP